MKNFEKFKTAEERSKESRAALAKAIKIRRKNREELELKYGGIG